MSDATRRRLQWAAPYVALLLVAAGLVLYAVEDPGDESAQPHLHDSGIWVVNDAVRWFGRLDKSIDQLDAAYFPQSGASTGLDVVQEDTAVVGVEGSTLAAIDPATIDVPDGGTTQLPTDAAVDLRGGSLAVLARTTGDLWATRLDPEGGPPDVGSLAGKEKPLAVAGPGAALAVAEDGSVVAYSATTGSLTTLSLQDGVLGSPAVVDAGKGSAGTTVTTVGDRAVLLSPEGSLRVVGGAKARLPQGSVLQQPGPAADSVLVGTPTGLAEVDLASGKVTQTTGTAGVPVPPVRLGGCAYGAWGSAGGAGLLSACGDHDSQLRHLETDPHARLVFRVNRGEIVLNDTSTGEVWDAESNLLTTLDDWQSFQSKDDDKGRTQQQRVDTGTRQTPLAVDDHLGVRPGRATVVHPLDNDITPDGRLLSVTRVTDLRGVKAVPSPDGQVVEVSLTGSGGGSFEYWVDDGDPGDKPVSATVHVEPRRGNEAPRPRPNYVAPQLVVAASGELDIPITRDWRDPDGDPVTLESVSTGGDANGSARVVDDSIIRFSAPGEGRLVTLTYVVSDGVTSTTERLAVRVQGPADLDAHPPVAEPDVVTAVQGHPVEISPLANDLPGSDPGDPTARLQIDSEVAGPTGTIVSTDERGGTVSFRSDAPGTYLLHYEAGFGNAAPDKGLIRVDVRASGADGGPMAMPDVATLDGTDPALVDVLANDSDPGLGVLTVTAAVPQHPDAVTASIVDGHWVRLQATGAATGPQVIDYTVSNGTDDTESQVVASLRPPRSTAAPTTAADQVTVRSGASLGVPVLANDASPTGDALHLVDAVTAGRAGELPVEDAAGRTDPKRVGRAYVSANSVRFLAPVVRDDTTVTVGYVAANSHGETAPGTLTVTVVGVKGPNRPPTPPTIEGRVSAGGTVRIPLPRSGVDPDGDPVSVTGLSQAPTLGRVLEVRADSVLYQAYPDSAGTDEFQYVVADDRGGVATGAIRVGIVPQSVPPPPQAVPDEVSAAPGRTVSVDVTANDQIAPGDGAKVTVRPGQKHLTVPSTDGTIVAVHVPDGATGDVTGVYQLSDGAATTAAEITVHVVKGYDNPPVAADVFAPDGAGRSVTVDLLQGAYDPDGSSLRVADVQAPAGVATRVGSRLVVRRGSQPQVIPFTVADPEGGVASATVFVPPLSGSRPEVRPDALVTVAPSGSVSARLSSYVSDASGAPLHFTGKNLISASPAGLAADITGDHTFRVSAAPDASGPGAVSFQVRAGSEPGKAAPTVVTVPVQIGTTRPVLSCPDDPLQIGEGTTTKVAVSTLCHVWTADPADADRVTLHASMQGGRGDVRASMSGRDVRLDARTGTTTRTATLKLTASLDGVASAPAPITVEVGQASAPTLAPIRLGDLRGGHTRTIDLAPYFHPGLPGSDTTRILSVGSAAGLAVHRSGQSKLQITARHGAIGAQRIPVTVTDVASGAAPAGRRATGTITVEVLDRPGSPGAPVPGSTVLSHRIHLTWAAPHPNGSPIDRYRLLGAGRSWTCASTSCDARVPKNGRPYLFRVQAHNAVGWSKPSRTSARAYADARPGEVGAIHVVSVGDHRVSLSWSKPSGDASLNGYRISWPGGARTTSQPHVTLTGLDNNSRYTFSVQGFNRRAGAGPIRRVTGQSIGTPGQPGRPHVTDTRLADDTGAVVVDWPQVSPNGPGPVTYTVFHNGKSAAGCRGITATRCQIGGIVHNGATHTFSVRATNAGVPGVRGGGRRTRNGTATSYAAVGTPAAFTDFTVTASGHTDRALIKLVVPNTHGKASTIHWYTDGREFATNENYRGSRTEQPQVGSDGHTHEVYAKVCNEAGRCSTSPTREVIPYGPISGTDAALTCDESTAGMLYWHYQFNGNGRPVTARWHTWINGQNERTGTVHGTAYLWGARRHTPKRAAKKGWHSKITLVVTDNGNGRAGSKSFTKICERN